MARLAMVKNRDFEAIAMVKNQIFRSKPSLYTEEKSEYCCSFQGEKIINIEWRKKGKKVINNAEGSRTDLAQGGGESRFSSK